MRAQNGYDIKMVLKEIVLEGLEWIALCEERNKWWAVVNMVMNLQVP